jgi:2'-5' RNA ligase
MRLFFALPVERQLAERLHRETADLRRLCPVCRPVVPENYHLTLKFLGETGEEKAAEMKDLLEDAGLRGDTDLEAVDYALHGLGAFPGTGNPSVLWAGIDPRGEGLKRIYEFIQKICLEAGFPEDTRPFHPHLTLARVKKREKVPGELVDYLRQNRERKFGNSSFREVVLFRSVLKPAGAEYQRFATLDLEKMNES